MNIRKILIMIFLSMTNTIFAQESGVNKEIEKAVNEQVWKPFKRAYEDRDWKLFNDLHTEDVLRISKWSGIRVGRDYKDAIKRSYQKEDTRRATIDLWFEHRFYSENLGYEVGYYRVTYDQPGKERRISHGRFHILLKKADGKWKIAQDWDVNTVNGDTVTAEDFAKGTPLKLDR